MDAAALQRCEILAKCTPLSGVKHVMGETHGITALFGALTLSEARGRGGPQQKEYGVKRRLPLALVEPSSTRICFH